MSSKPRLSGGKRKSISQEKWDKAAKLSKKITVFARAEEEEEDVANKGAGHSEHVGHSSAPPVPSAEPVLEPGAAVEVGHSSAPAPSAEPVLETEAAVEVGHSSAPVPSAEPVLEPDAAVAVGHSSAPAPSAEPVLETEAAVEVGHSNALTRSTGAELALEVAGEDKIESAEVPSPGGEPEPADELHISKPPTDVELRSEQNEADSSEAKSPGYGNDGQEKSGVVKEMTVEERVAELSQMLTPFPSDRGLFKPESKQQPDLKTRDFVIQCGPCQPDIKFPKNGKGRHFSVAYYYLRSETGLNIKRKWLCYSPILDKAYCETCWLFGDRGSPLFRSEWVLGILNWKNIGEKAVGHEICRSHVLASKSRTRYEENKTIATDLDRTLLKEADRWREVLRRLFKIILSLCASNNPLRGHLEKIDSPNPGNFLREVKLVAEFDPVLHNLIYDKDQKVKYLSHHIQDEIVQIMGAAVRLEICDEIRQAKYYSIIMDSTTDITKTEQVSIILRYCHFDNSGCLSIKEAFVGFFELYDRSARGYETLLIGILKDLNLDFKLCRGQGYDGASVMSGAHCGLQANLSKLNENAPYIHCAAHKLNLVLSDAVKSKACMSDFFGTIQAVYSFFHLSGVRWKELENICKEGISLKRQCETITLKKVCETRWEARYASVLAIKTRYVDILKVLTKIILTSKKTDEVAEARGIKKRIENFQFIIILVFWEKVLRPFRALSKKLQSIEMSLSDCVHIWKNCMERLNELKTNIHSIKDEAKEMAKRWGVPTEFSTARNVKRTRFHDGIGIDTARKTLMGEDTLFYETLIPCIDCAIFQMKTRFESTQSIYQIFEFMLPNNMKSMKDYELSQMVDNFCSKYEFDVNSDLLAEIQNFKSCMKEELESTNTIYEIVKLITKFNLRESFPNLLVSCLTFLTLPVSVSSAERSFSKMKLIKNYARSTMLEERLRNMALLSIESIRAQKLDIDKMIHVFAHNKARRNLKFN